MARLSITRESLAIDLATAEPASHEQQDPRARSTVRPLRTRNRRGSGGAAHARNQRSAAPEIRRQPATRTNAGLPEPWATRRETPLSHSFCQHVVAARETVIITDTRRVVPQAI